MRSYKVKTRFLKKQFSHTVETKLSSCSCTQQYSEGLLSGIGPYQTMIILAMLMHKFQIRLELDLDKLYWATREIAFPSN